MNRVVCASAFLLVFFTLSIHLPLSAEIYRWVDGKGHVHFSDAKNKPEHASKAELIEVAPNVVKTQPGLTPKPKRSVKKKKSRESATMNSAQHSASSNDKKCARAKTKLENVRSRMRAGLYCRSAKKAA